MKNPILLLKPSILLLLTLLCAAVASVQIVHAATITVMNTSDSGAGSLRQVLADANDGDTIDFDAAVTGTITLSSGELLVNDSITISGPGANILAVDGNAASRVFHIASGKTVTLSGLTITDGTAGSGGGIYNDNATLTINNSTLSGNSATDVNSGGGGIFNNRATLTINNSTLSGNSAPNADRNGGGIYNNGNGGSATLTINNSTLSGNSTGGNGGGIVNQGPFGSATLTINNSTLSGNSAGFNGGGIYNNGVFGSATLTIGDTILNAGGISNNSGTVTSLGYNLSSDDGGGFLTNTGDQINTDPMLGALAYYGGPTPTHILLAGSPAINMGNPSFTPPPNYDQRGPDFDRVVNGRIDIGAFERQATDIDPTLIVTKTADTNDGTCDSDCSLREAITAANASAPDDAIYFAVTGTITLNANGALAALNSNMKILGPGANALTVQRDSAASAFRIFLVNSGKTVTLSGLTITDGTAGSGGGIYNDNATLTINNSTLSGNSATDVNSGGGGIFNNRATLTINNSTLSGNSAPNADRNGGGIYNNGNGGSATLTINNSTLSGNSTGGNGGGIVNQGPFGSATLTINNSTLSGNSAGFNGGGIYNNGVFGSATLTIGDTILNAGGISNNSGMVTSLGYNLSSDDGGGFLTNTGDQINTDPMLGALQDNGGPTFTHELLTGSPAINAGDPSFTPPPNYDQRGPGFDRVVNGRIDKGAFEVQAIICPQGQGYWKNNPGAWPVEELTLGNETYSKADLLMILNTPIGTGKKADASLILADQLIAAKLNVANGADGAPVTSTIADADTLLSGFGGVLPYHVKPSTMTGQAMVNDGATLERFNKGMLTAGCGG